MATRNQVDNGLFGTTGTGTFVGSNAPTIVTPIIAQINDVNAATMLTQSPAVSPVNNWEITNAVTGSGPALNAVGTDADIAPFISSKGDAPIRLNTRAVANDAVRVNSGANRLHITKLMFPSTETVTRTVTFPDADGTVTLLGNTSTGSGAVVLATSPTLVTPALGTPSSGDLQNCTGYPTSGLTGLGTGVATALAINVGTSGAIVVQDGALGTPSSGTLTNATGLPISTGVSGLGTSVATALAVNVGTAGAFVVNGGALGTPSSGTLTSCTGLPISTGVSGLGTGVATALAINVGTAGSFITNGGALGTPSSGTLTNATGLPISTGVSGLGTGVATALALATNANGGMALASSTSTTTVELLFGGSSTGITYSGTPYIRSTRSGNFVYFNGLITLTSKGTATGAATITALPIATKSGSGFHINAIITSNSSYTGTMYTLLGGGVTTISLYVCNGGTLSLANDTQFTNTSSIYLNGYYEAT